MTIGRAKQLYYVPQVDYAATDGSLRPLTMVHPLKVRAVGGVTVAS